MNLIRYQTPELSNWNPFDRLASLRDEMNRLFDLGSTGGRDLSLFNGWSPALDIYQDRDNVTVRVEVPGMKKEDIDISLHEGNLTISGERKVEKEEGQGETFRSERFFGRFQRTVHRRPRRAIDDRHSPRRSVADLLADFLCDHAAKHHHRQQDDADDEALGLHRSDILANGDDEGLTHESTLRRLPSTR